MNDAILVIPAHDEAEHLPAVLRRVAEADPGLAIVVVDDGSSDATAAVAAAAGARVIRHPYNLGYGAAVQTGYKYALACGVDIVVQLDADGQHDPAQISRLLDPVRRGECDLAIGSRFLTAGGYRMGAGRALGRDLFRGLARLFGMHVTDPTSGFQALNRRVLEIYAEDFFPSDFPDVDVLVIAHRAGARIHEFPVEMSEGARASRLHGGLRPIYYAYKMLLSLWAASARPGAHTDPGGSNP